MQKTLRRIEIGTEEVLPRELQRSAPRDVVLTGAGRAVVACSVALAAGALLLGWVLGGKASRERALAQEAADLAQYTEARVTQVRRTRGESPQVRVSYRFPVRGVEYGGTGRLARRDPRWRTIREGDAVRVGYLPSRPEVNWLQGYDPRPTPLWAVFAAPAGLAAASGLLLLPIRRQKRLLEEGRAAMARVRAAKKIRKEHDVWRIEYEWQLLSGAMRTGHVDRSGKTPPAEGFLPVVYDRENPARHAVYPFSLVRVGQM